MSAGQGAPGDWYISVAGGGQTIASFDTFVEMRFKTGSALPIMPVEQGSFFTANKWMLPYNAMVQLAKMGDAGVINEMMVALEQYKNSTDIVDIVTPYFTFIHGNLYDIEYDFSVDETGVGMAAPRLSIQEVRFIQESATSTSDITGAKNAESNSTVNNGKQTPRQSEARKDFGSVISGSGGTA